MDNAANLSNGFLAAFLDAVQNAANFKFMFEVPLLSVYTNVYFLLVQSTLINDHSSNAVYFITYSECKKYAETTFNLSEISNRYK